MRMVISDADLEQSVISFASRVVSFSYFFKRMANGVFFQLS